MHVCANILGKLCYKNKLTSGSLTTEQFAHHHQQLPSDGEFSTKYTIRQAVYDVCVHNTKCDEDNIP